ncbi:hypothetical protein K469DRAFT_724132 [Zopfia rhizophila CBS 207.26]|uniref:Uncharacterized protein n=1 Tax=Zopfia rhizophila CBS 207.26 TaxID=1314779 RepID=A0A6A6DB46_9PEZI|nr:hypothetical protein K469DRAFT_724132 [Zopfia rhizophila CBS 207.26]
MARVRTLIRLITFHVVLIRTPFLLCLADMDRLRVKLDNLINKLVQELKRLHRRFGHPLVKKLTNLLQRANPEDLKCYACQISRTAPGRFRFRLKSDKEFNFNYEIIVDIFYLNNRPPKTLRHNAGKNFTSSKFRLKAFSIAISVKEIPVKAYNSVGKIKQYHALLRRAFNIIRSESVKAVNDTVEPNSLVPTLLVFRAYLRITKTSLLLPNVYERVEVIRKAMHEIKKIHT